MVEGVSSVVDSENGSFQNQITRRLPRKARQAAASIAESATKELQSLAEIMPNLADTDARTLALRLYYVELTDGVSPIRARNKVSQMFLAIRHPSVLYVVQPQGKCSCRHPYQQDSALIRLETATLLWHFPRLKLQSFSSLCSFA